MRRLECLDGLRGVLAVYVMLGHMAPFAVLPGRLAGLLSHGGAAVDMFFILSGMVIVGSLERFRYRPRPFLAARAARIFPAFLIIFPLALIVQPLPDGFALMPWIGPDSAARHIWSDGWPDAWAAEIAAHLTMTHGLFPNCVLPDMWVSFLGSAWSLSTEWQFYVFALIAGRPAGQATGDQRRLTALLLVLAASGLVWHCAAPEAWHFSRAFLPNKAQYFALGVASATFLGDGARSRYALVLMAVLMLCAAQGGGAKLVAPMAWMVCLAAQRISRDPQRAALRVSSLRAAVALCLRPVVLLLGGRIAGWFGAVSYTLYLANEPIQKLLGVGLSRLVAGDASLFTMLWLPGATLLPLVLAAWLHRRIEMPSLRWTRGRVARMA
jgi:peptidoglycan/LPS O-acetylase OafA/YrhL